MKSPWWCSLIFSISILIGAGRCDRIDLIRCAEQPWCLSNLNGETLQVIREHMYNSTEPCRDFWDYACGSWKEGPYYDHVDTLGAMTNYYADQLMTALEVLQTSARDFEEISSMVTKIWKYFQACRKAGKYYVEMSNYLKEIPIKRSFGESVHEWKQLFDNNSTIWQTCDWLKLLAILRPYGLNDVFFRESVSFAVNDSSRYILEVRMPEAQKTFRSKYKVFEIFEEFQFQKLAVTEDLWQMAQQLYAFDKELVELYRRYEESGQNMKIIRVDQLQSPGVYIDWQMYFDVLAEKHVDVHGIPIQVSGKLEYFKDLQMLLQEKDKSLIVWYILMHFFKYLIDAKPLVTDRECLLHTNVMFPLGLNYIYSRFLYKNRDEDEKIMQNIFQDVKEQFSLYLQQNKFLLPEEELEYLTEKLSTVQLQIGNIPPQVPALNEYYAAAHISDGNFFRNHLEMLKFRFQQQHEVIWRSYGGAYLHDYYYVNDDIARLRNAPYFVHARNLLIMPMVFLQLPFYHHSQYSLFHYSLVGWLMSHELSHAFDSYGLNFDAEGNYSPMGHNISQKPRYVKTLNCLIAHKTTTSLNERMADVNGLQLIWDLYSRKFLNTNKLQVLSDVQELFFINFAQFFCGSLPPTSTHDLDNVRVNEALLNLREFTQIFRCTNDNGNTTGNYCDIWRK